MRTSHYVTAAALLMGVTITGCSSSSAPDAASSTGHPTSSSSTTPAVPSLTVPSQFSKIAGSTPIQLGSGITKIRTATNNTGSTAAIMTQRAGGKTQIIGGSPDGVRAWRRAPIKLLPADDIAGFAVVGTSAFVAIQGDDGLHIASYNTATRTWVASKTLPGSTWTVTSWGGFIVMPAAKSGAQSGSGSATVGHPDGSITQQKITAAFPKAGAGGSSGTFAGFADSAVKTPVWNYVRKSNGCREAANTSVSGPACKQAVMVGSLDLTSDLPRGVKPPGRVTATGGGYVAVTWAADASGSATKTTLWNAAERRWVGSTDCAHAVSLTSASTTDSGGIWVSPNQRWVEAAGVLFNVVSPNKDTCITTDPGWLSTATVLSPTGGGYVAINDGTATDDGGSAGGYFVTGASSLTKETHVYEPFAFTPSGSGLFVGQPNGVAGGGKYVVQVFAPRH